MGLSHVYTAILDVQHDDGISQEEDVHLILSQLLVVHVHPATEACTGTRQCLAVFFEVSFEVKGLRNGEVTSLFAPFDCLIGD